MSTPAVADKGTPVVTTQSPATPVKPVKTASKTLLAGFDLGTNKSCILAGPATLRALGISELYLPLLYVDVVSAGLQVVLLGLLNINFYLDRRPRVLLLTVLLLVLNLFFTALSIMLGPYYFGYGFAAALLVTVVVGMVLLNRDFELLEYETFMLQ